MNLVIVDNIINQQLQQIEAIRDNLTHNSRHWTKWLRETGNNINPESVKEYFEYLNTCTYTVMKKVKGKKEKEPETRNFSPGTIITKRTVIKNRIRILARQSTPQARIILEQILKDIDLEVKKPAAAGDGSFDREKAITKEQYQYLLSKCRSDRQKCFIMFLFETGCRINELTTTELAKCKDKGDYFEITVRGKGTKYIEYKERPVKISNELYDFIIKTFNPEKYLFETSNKKKYDNTYISKQVKTCGKRIGKNISAHILRHSFASAMVDLYPNKLDEISRFLGHAKVSTTVNTYVHSTLSTAELFSLSADSHFLTKKGI